MHQKLQGLEQALIKSSVQLLSHVQLFATPWTAAHQASLSITNSQSLLKHMPIESVMPSNHLILCRPLLLPPSIFPSSKASVLWCSAFFIVQLSLPYMTTGKTIALTRQTKVMSLLFNMLSSVVIAFLPRSKYLLISWLQSRSSVILEPPKIKLLTVSPSIFLEVMGPDAMIFIF